MLTANSLPAGCNTNNYGKIFTYQYGPVENPEEFYEEFYEVAGSFTEMLEKLKLFISKDNSWEEIDFDGVNIIYL